MFFLPNYTLARSHCEAQFCRCAASPDAADSARAEAFETIKVLETREVGIVPELKAMEDAPNRLRRAKVQMTLAVLGPDDQATDPIAQSALAAVKPMEAEKGDS